MSLYSVGISALNVAQAGIATTGHNIANANTAGYRRQDVVQTTNTSVDLGVGYLGQGSRVDTLRRAYDDFLERQVSQNEAGASYQDQYLKGLQQVDGILGDRQAGFSAVIQNYFKSWTDLANYPASTAAREAVLGAAHTVVDNLKSLNGYLQNLQTSNNSQVSGVVRDINGYSAGIASLNLQISQLLSSGKPPNDLLDKRDEMVSNLNELAGITVVKESGNYNVFLGGYSLVVGGSSIDITAAASPYDASEMAIYDAGGSAQLSGSAVSGGKLGALLDYRRNVLNVAENSLGRIAMSLAASTNTQHAAGVDYNGAAGGNFFNDMSTLPEVFPNSGNTGGSALTATISNTSQLTTSDYMLGYDGTNYKLTRVSDGKSWSDSNIATLATTAAQGFSLAISAAPAAGDTFMLRPAMAGAASLDVAITDPLAIAAAAGTATAGQTLDNTNALAIAALQSNATLIGGSATIEGGYANFVGVVGSMTSNAKFASTAAASLLTQAQSAQQATSGVNLDEEAANLIRYQQAYQAAAQIIKTASSMFDSLLALGNQ